jgi:pyridoxal phosphate enzyme (YggS family)
MDNSIQSNIEKINERIVAAAARSGRSASDITLIAVSKTVGAEQVQEAYAAGIRNFGENRAQELALKRSRLPDLDCVWHFIGHLQSNKAKDALAHANLIHSVDSLQLAAEIDRRAGILGVTAKIFAQINISSEETKSGIDPAEALTFVESLSALKNIRILGLMTIAQPSPDPEAVRPEFQRMKLIFDEVSSKIVKPNVQMKYLSMGMSGDFEVAIEEGSNMVRIGTAIFGERHY